jgi:hypothetical protein
MSIIDSSYLIGEILITNKTQLAAVLQTAIDQYEPEILKSLLGYSEYKKMIATPNDEPYKSLIEGAEFEMTFDGITQTLKWEGLKNSIKISLISYYVYYRYQESEYIKPGAVGTNKPQAENAKIVSPYPKMVTAWNNMINLYGWFDNYWFKTSNANIIQPDGGLIFNDSPSAYNYMSANVADFPDWIFRPLRTINPFGI